MGSWRKSEGVKRSLRELEEAGGSWRKLEGAGGSRREPGELEGAGGRLFIPFF